MAVTTETTDLDALTARQREIYRFIRGKIQGRGYGPTIREIGTEFGIKSTSGVMTYLRALEKEGLIHRELNVSRAIRTIKDVEDDFSMPPQAKDLIEELARQTQQDPGRVVHLSAELYRLALEATKRGERVAFVDSSGHIVQQVNGLLPEDEADDDVAVS